MKKILFSLVLILSLSCQAFAAGIDSYTKLMLHCNGTNLSTSFPDASTASHTMTAQGAAHVSTAQAKFGTGSYLGAATAYLTTPASSDFSFGAAGSGDFTVDCWIFFIAHLTTAGICGPSDGSNLGWAFYYSAGGGQLRIDCKNTVEGINWSPNDSQWYHLALVRSGSTVTMYVDGTSIGTVGDLSFTDDSQVFAVGSNDNTGSNPINGYIDELRTSKGVARWTSNFTPESSEYTASDTSSFFQLMD